MKNTHLISTLATIGILSICWMIFPAWLVGIIAFFSIFIAVYLNQKLLVEQKIVIELIQETYIKNNEVKPIKRQNLEWFTESLFMQLMGSTIEEGIEYGIITEIGDNEGNFLLYEFTDDRVINYAVINNYKIYVNEDVANAVNLNEELIGKLYFEIDEGEYSLILPRD